MYEFLRLSLSPPQTPSPSHPAQPWSPSCIGSHPTCIYTTSQKDKKKEEKVYNECISVRLPLNIFAKVLQNACARKTFRESFFIDMRQSLLHIPLSLHIGYIIIGAGVLCLISCDDTQVDVRPSPAEPLTCVSAIHYSATSAESVTG